MDKLQVTTEIVDGATVIAPAGDIDMTASPVFRQELRKASDAKVQRLVIDLSKVPYMDSSGLATLVEAMQSARKNKTRLVLCGLTERVRSIFAIAKLETLFTVTATREQALAA